MNYTLKHYERAVDRFVDDMRPLGQDLMSALLFGSIARGDVRPGKSDLLDACLVLRSEVCHDRTRFMNALQVFANAVKHLRETGLPTHPFFYWYEYELDRSPAMWLSLWGSDETSKVLSGEDVRPRLKGREESKMVARTSVFHMRQIAHRLGRYMYQESLSEEDCDEIIEQLANLKKFFPILACLACDNWITETHGAEEIGKTLPGIATDVLPRIMSFRDHPPERSDLQAWRSIIADFLRFIEQVHVALPDGASSLVS